jgi:hypothetical protein
VVGYDSIILPGRVGSITESVNLGNYHSGNYTKSATITSNARNLPTMQISMKWVIKAYVTITPSFIDIVKNKTGTFENEVTLSSEKTDLKLLEVSFKSGEGQQGADKIASWKDDLPVHVSFVFLKDTVAQPTMHDFKYKLTASYGDTKVKSGEFIFKTNHPEAQEVKTNGQINPTAPK